TATVLTFDHDPNAANDAATATVQVVNVPPEITSIGVAAPAINENDEAVLTVVFKDPGKYDTHDAVIDWGDGPAQIVPIPPGDRQFTVRHRYLDDDPTGTPFDTYAIRVTVRDNNGGSGTGQTATRVDNVTPVVTAFTSDAVECGDKAEGDTVHVTGAFTDVG